MHQLMEHFANDVAAAAAAVAARIRFSHLDEIEAKCWATDDHR